MQDSVPTLDYCVLANGRQLEYSGSARLKRAVLVYMQLLVSECQGTCKGEGDYSCLVSRDL